MRICLKGHQDKRNATKCQVCGLATLLICPTTLKSVKEPKIDGVMISCDATPRCITQKHRWIYVAPMKEIKKDIFTKSTNFPLDKISEIKEGEIELPFLHSE